MHYLIDKRHKVIIGINPKCGCSNIIRFFIDISEENRLLFIKKQTLYYSCEKLPSDYIKYKIFIIIRNPFERLVSGVLNKYYGTYDEEKHGNYIKNFNKSGLVLNFKNFVNILINYPLGKYIDKHHFMPQLSEYWTDDLLKHPNIIFYDINNVNFMEIQKCFNNDFNDYDTYKVIKKNPVIIKDAHLIEIPKLTKSINYNCLYTKELKQYVYNYYKNDFDIFKILGFNYDI